MVNIKLIEEFKYKMISEIEKRLIGNTENIMLVLTTMLAKGHILIEGVP